jgi:hypothetical protein
MHDFRTRHVVWAGIFDRRDADFEGDEADRFLGVDRIMLLVVGEGWFEVEGIEVGIVEKADHAAPCPRYTIRVLGRKLWGRLFNYHCGVRGAAGSGREAVRRGAEEGLLAMSVEAAMCPLGEGAEVVT